MAPTVKTISRMKMKDNTMKTITNKCGNIVTIDGIKAVIFNGFAYSIALKHKDDGQYNQLMMISVEPDHFLNNFLCPGGGAWTEKWYEVYDMTAYSPGGRNFGTTRDKFKWFKFEDDLIHIYGVDAVREALKAVKLS